MKKNSIIIMLVIGVLIPLNISALTGSVNLNCNETVLTVNNSTTCTLSGNSNEEISSLSAILSASGSISISNISTSNIWQGNGLDGSIELYTDNNKIGNFAIATFTIKASGVSGTGTINLNSVNFYDAAFNAHSIAQKNLTITVKEAEKPKQENNTQNNNIQNNNTQNNNTQNNNIQNNNIQNNNIQNNKPVENDQTKSSDATLKSILLSHGSINFSSNILEYNIEVSNEVKKVSISAEANDNKAKVSIPNELNLKVGINSFEIKVIAEDDTSKIYKLNINRLERELSKNSNLKSLKIEGHKLSFSTNNHIYDIKNITSSYLNIDAVAEDENATIEIYGNKSIGKNDSIVIEVIAEDGSTSEYIVYANNVEKSNSNIGFIIVLFLLIISLGLNLFMIIKKIKTNKNILSNKKRVDL